MHTDEEILCFCHSKTKLAREPEGKDKASLTAKNDGQLIFISFLYFSDTDLYSSLFPSSINEFSHFILHHTLLGLVLETKGFPARYIGMESEPKEMMHIIRDMAKSLDRVRDSETLPGSMQQM